MTTSFIRAIWQRLLDVLERFDTVGLVHSAFEFIDARSRVIQTVNPVASRSAVKIDRRDLALERLMVTPWGLGFPSVMYRTDAIVELGGFREEEGAFCDLPLWMRMALRWDFGYTRYAPRRIPHPSKPRSQASSRPNTE